MTMAANTEPPEQETAPIPTNLRLLMVLEEVVRAGVPVTATEANAALGLPKPTIHRLFATLEQEGFLQRELNGRAYTPGRRLRRLALGTMSSMRERSARAAILNALAEELGETCNIAVPDRDAMVYLDRVETTWPLRVQMPVGTRVPLHCTAGGKMFLSTLNDTHLARYLDAAKLSAHTQRTITDPVRLAEEIAAIRERGYAMENEEFMDGMICVAVPVTGQHGALISTLSFHAPTQRMTLDEALAHLPRLRRSAEELSRLALEDD